MASPTTFIAKGRRVYGKKPGLKKKLLAIAVDKNMAKALRFFLQYMYEN